MFQSSEVFDLYIFCNQHVVEFVQCGLMYKRAHKVIHMKDYCDLLIGMNFTETTWVIRVCHIPIRVWRGSLYHKTADSTHP